MNLFEKLTNQTVNSYVISSTFKVKNNKERFRTPNILRERLTKKKMFKTMYKIEDNNLYVVYTSLNKPGFNIKSTKYMDISKYEKHFKNQLELFNGNLTFKIAEEGDDYIVLQLPLRTIGNVLNNNPGVGRSATVTVTEDMEFEIKHKYHIGKVTAKKLSEEYKLPYNRVLKLVEGGI
jgi:hypothetical protein